VLLVFVQKSSMTAAAILNFLFNLMVYPYVGP